MKPPPFRYERACSVEEAVDLLARLGDDAKLLAGGQSLVPMMNLRLARPTALIDINPLTDLAYVRTGADGLRIGALTRHVRIERDPLIAERFDVLRRAAAWVGHYPIRARGTFGGSLAHADPAAEWCVLATLLDAELVAVGPAGERLIPASAFFEGFLETTLQGDEVLVEVRLPNAPRQAGFAEFARRHGDFAIVAAAVAFDDTDHRCRNVRVALGGVTRRAVRVREAETLLEGEELTDASVAATARAAGAAVDPPDDVHGTSEYRRFLVTGLVARALGDAGLGATDD